MKNILETSLPACDEVVELLDYTNITILLKVLPFLDTNYYYKHRIITKWYKNYALSNQNIDTPTNLSSAQELGDERLSKITETKLDLVGKKIITLPNSFGNTFTNLVTLDLWGNLLTGLPRTFGNLTNLVHLNLIANHLESLPDSFGNLLKLKVVYISSNRLKRLSESFGNLINLTHIDLSSNLLQELPNSFINLSKLLWLNLKWNEELIITQSVVLDTVRFFRTP